MSTSTSNEVLHLAKRAWEREGKGGERKGKGLVHASCTHCQGHIVQFRLTALGEVDTPTEDSHTLRSSLHTTTLFVGMRNVAHLNSP